MFEEFMGVPAHPLLIHAAVVLVPLLAVMAIAYAVVPFVRPHTRWVLGLLALATPFATLFAKLSGDAFFRRLQGRNAVTPEFRPTLENHQNLGTMTLYATIVLALVVLAMVYLIGPGIAAATAEGGTAGSTRVVPLILATLSVLTAVVALYYVIRTGDSGAKAVWTGS